MACNMCSFNEDGGGDRDGDLGIGSSAADVVRMVVMMLRIVMVVITLGERRV